MEEPKQVKHLRSGEDRLLTSSPANDLLANAAAIPLGSVVTGTTIGASVESGEPLAGYGATASIWYTWVSGSPATVTVSTAGSNFDTLLAVYTDSSSTLSGLTRVISNDDCARTAGVLTSCVTFVPTAGTRYAVQIAGYAGGKGNVTVLVSRQQPSNDNLESRSVISSTLPASAYGTTVGATLQAGETPAGYGAAGSVWYSWRSLVSQTVSINTFNSSFDTLLAVYTSNDIVGAFASHVRVAFNDDCRGRQRAHVHTNTQTVITHEHAHAHSQ